MIFFIFGKSIALTTNYAWFENRMVWKFMSTTTLDDQITASRFAGVVFSCGGGLAVASFMMFLFFN